jgi:hypothetical protein
MQLEKALATLQREKEHLHENLMREQERAAKSRQKGEKNIEQKKWPTIKSKTKLGRGNVTSGEKMAALSDKKEDVLERWNALEKEDIISPHFHLTAKTAFSHEILSIREGCIGYETDKWLLENI